MKQFIYRNFHYLNEYSFGMILAVLGSALVYWIGFSGPINLLNLYRFTRLDQLYLKMNGLPAIMRITMSFIILAFAYLMAFRWSRHVHGKVGWFILFGGMLAFGIVLLFMAPFDSTDIYDNIMHGRIISIYHANPYIQTGANFPLDAFSQYMGWPNDISAYGPLWEFMAAGVARLAGNGQVANLIAFKLLTGFFTLLCTGMIAVILQERAPAYALSGTLLFAWNPVVLFETFGQGHNDPAMLFWILVAVYALSNKHFTWAIMSLVAGGLVKFLPVLFLPAAGLIALQELHTFPRRARFVVGLALLTVLLVGLSYAPFWHGFSTLSVARRSRMFATSLPSMIFFTTVPKIGFDQAVKLIGPIAGALTVAFALAMGFWARNSRARDRFSVSTLLILNFYLLITILWFWPWYTLWLLGLAPLVKDRRFRVLAVMLSITAMVKNFLVSPLLNIVNPGIQQPWLEIYQSLTVLALPWAYSIYALISHWRESQVSHVLERVVVDVDDR